MSLQDLLDTRPTVQEVQDAAALCSRTTTDIPSGIFGISQPQRFGHKRMTNKDIDRAYEVGAQSIRMEIKLDQLYPSNGATPDWTQYDIAIDRIHGHGMSILAIITYMPTWLPSDWAQIDTAMQSMFTAVLTHLEDKGVEMIECFNEPNLTGFGWLGKPTDPGFSGIMSEDFLGPYLLLMCRMNKCARDINTGFIFMNGGLSNDPAHEWVCSVQTFFAALVQGQCENVFDVMAFHPYGLQGQFGSGRVGMNALLSAIGRADAPVWANEYGWAGWEDMDLLKYSTSDDNPLLKIVSQLPAWDAYYHFNIADYSQAPGTPTFGLCGFYGRKRPGFVTLKREFST